MTGETPAPARASVPKPLHVALYGGIVMEHDAVSNSLLLKLRLLQRLRAAGFPLQVTAFTQASDFDDPDILVVPHVGALMRQRHFMEADIHIFEYGMWYELFNALFVIDQPSLVIDHNTTPPELVEDPIVKLACEKAMFERHNLDRATRIATVSEYTRLELIDMGLGPELIDVLHLPPNNSGAASRHREFTDPVNEDRLELLFVGRLVRAKGIDDLLAAMEQLWAHDPRLRLTIAGSLRFSQASTLAAVEHAVARHGSTDVLRLECDASDATIARMYETSDLFVMPSHHEGYCVPVVEALRSGCFVIGTDAGNIPNVMGQLGRVVPSGDSEALASSIADFARRVRQSRSGSPLVFSTDRGEMTADQWHAAVRHHLEGYSLEAFELKFLEILEDLASDAVAAGAGWLTRALRGQAPDPAIQLLTT